MPKARPIFLPNEGLACLQCVADAGAGWHHGKSLCKLAGILKVCRLGANPITPSVSIKFIRQAAECAKNNVRACSLLSPEASWC